MPNYDLEEYIQKNINDILESHRKQILEECEGLSAENIIVAYLDDLSFIKNIQGKNVELSFVDIKNKEVLQDK